MKTINLLFYRDIKLLPSHEKDICILRIEGMRRHYESGKPDPVPTRVNIHLWEPELKIFTSLIGIYLKSRIDRLNDIFDNVVDVLARERK